MQVAKEQVALADLPHLLNDAIGKDGKERLGHFTSIDGSQLITLLLHPQKGTVRVLETALDSNSYPCLTNTFPQLHWFERLIFDMFGIVPSGHPRFKHLNLHDQYPENFYPLRKASLPEGFKPPIGRAFKFLEVKGEGVYELPVGPIHAGIIEPGHFRFSCYGETIVNLEVRLGFVHRGVEKRLCEVPFAKAHFVAEAAASDTSAANALAHCEAIESVMGIEVSERARYLRTIALEIERLACHIIDVGGMGTDIGLLGISATMGRLRGRALGLGDLITGSRFLRGFILPGGVRPVAKESLAQFKGQIARLRHELKEPLQMFLDNQMGLERMRDIGVLPRSLCNDFGMVGVACRATGIEYDTRRHFAHGAYPELAPPAMTAKGGDILAREMVRIKEIWSSLDTLDRLIDNLPDGPDSIKIPDKLPPDQIGIGIVEAFRGELIHMIVTDSNGQITRYAIKDPSFNNWTAIAIAIRNNLIADFPLCNKSLALSYSGSDL